jgi:hypothetical protein
MPEHWPSRVSWHRLGRQSAKTADPIDQAFVVQSVDRHGMNVAAGEAADPLLVHDVGADSNTGRDLGVQVRNASEELAITLPHLGPTGRLQLAVCAGLPWTGDCAGPSSRPTIRPAQLSSCGLQAGAASGSPSNAERPRQPLSPAVPTWPPGVLREDLQVIPYAAARTASNDVSRPSTRTSSGSETRCTSASAAVFDVWTSAVKCVIPAARASAAS